MSHETFSISSGPSGQHEFAANAVKLVTAQSKDWGVPDAMVTKLTNSFNDYDAKYAVTSNPATRSPTATTAEMQRGKM